MFYKFLRLEKWDGGKMYKYRLTQRGKAAVLTLILITLAVFCMVSVRISASAKDNSETRIVKDSTKINTANLSPLRLQSKKTADIESLDDLLNQHINIEKENEMLRQSEAKSSSGELCINAEQAYAHDGKKIAFLTFDDGPSKDITPGVLEILSKYDVKATFFVLGCLCKSNSDTIQKMVHAGNAIGIHTYSHRYSVIYGSTGNFLNEINKTDSVLKQILGEQFNTRLFRFPGGSSGKDRAPFKRVLAKAGYVYIDWNALTGDGESSDLTPKQLEDRLKATSKNKSHIVILMHDSESKSTTLQALPKIIEYLRDSGYEFSTLK